MFKEGVYTLLVVALLSFLIFLWKTQKQKLAHLSKNLFSLGGRKKILEGLVLLISATFLQTIFDFFQLKNSIGVFQAGVPILILILYMGGVALILWGAGEGVKSIITSKAQAQRRLRQLICFKGILRFSQKTSTREELLKESLNSLCSIMGYSLGVIYKPAFNSHQISLITHFGFDVSVLPNLYSFNWKNSFFEESFKTKELCTTSEIDSLKENGAFFSEPGKIKSAAFIPIKFKEKIMGVMGLYTQEEKFNYQECQFLSDWGKLLGSLSEEMLVAKRNQQRREYLSALEELGELLKEENRLREVFPLVAKILKRVIDFDFVSLAFLDASGQNMSCISLGAGGNLFFDKGVSMPTYGTAIHQVVKSGEALLDSDLTQQTKFIDTEWLKTLGIKSRLIAPLFWNKAKIGTLTLGKMETDFYSGADTKWLKPFLSQLSWFMVKEKKSQESDRKSHFLEKAFTYVQRILEKADSQEILDSISQTITHELPTSFCRISVLDENQSSLTTRSLYSIREQGIRLNREIKLPLAELPWHNLALEEKRTLLVNQEEPESVMSDTEAGLILSQNIHSAILAPLIVEGQPKGVISLGEMRNWQRRPFSKNELEFVDFMASFLSLCLEYENRNSSFNQKEKFEAELEQEKGEHRDWDRFLSSLSYHINNPLASILGSVELLQMRNNLTSDEAKRYLQHIEKGAKRIHNTLEELKEKENTEEGEWIFAAGQPSSV
jgi:transcriptional regulator with GAF, ATPase, and Fis domain